MAARSPAVNLNISPSYTEIVDAAFMRAVFDEGLLTIRGEGWITGAGIEDTPGEVIARAAYFHAACQERLVRIGAAIAQLVLNERSLTVRVAAPDPHDAEAALQEVRAAMPEAEGAEQEVPVRFWWWQPHIAQEMARMMPAPSWSEIAANYAAPTTPELGSLMGWTGGPPSGGRLVLWHGAPGTGKTTALRALAWEWRDWAEFQFITDPEQFLSNPSYLLRTISDARRATSLPSPVGRWRLLVLEDAGEYLAPDAKRLAGQALSRLLNVCDGVLGHATRSLVLVTTNEPMRSLHPALSRPGRCLAQIEFEELSRAEIERWCEDREVQPPDVSRATLADLFAHVDGRAPARQGSGFGFSQAA